MIIQTFNLLVISLHVEIDVCPEDDLQTFYNFS